MRAERVEHGKDLAIVSHTGKLGASMVSAPTPVIVRFADGQVLDFNSADDAHGFLAFYNKSPSARQQNPAKVYLLQDGVWNENS